MRGGKGKIRLLAALMLAGSLTGCAQKTEESELAKEELQSFEPEIVASCEAEDATLVGKVHTDATRTGYSGEGYATGFEQDGDACVFTVASPKDGFYDLDFYTASTDYKENYVYLDGESLGTVVTEAGDFAKSTVSRVYLTEGEHEIRLEKYWGGSIWINWKWQRRSRSILRSMRRPPCLQIRMRTRRQSA